MYLDRIGQIKTMGKNILFLLFILCYSPLVKGLETYEFSVKSNYGVMDVQFHTEPENMGYAKRVEEILRADAPKVMDYFHHAPDGTVHFLINSRATTANGLATTVPRDQIYLNLIPPVGEGHLVTLDDWNRGLVLHELTHVIHLDLIKGVNRLLGTLFGAPAGRALVSLVPRWFTEGIAVWAEAQFTYGGRPRNDLYNLQIDALFLDPNFCQGIGCLDQPGQFPWGGTSYWMGGKFLSFLEKKKPGTLRCLVHENSDNIPFFLGSAFEDCTGGSAGSLFQQFRRTMVERASRQMKETVQIMKKTPYKRLPLPSTPQNWEQGFFVSEGRLYNAEVVNENLIRVGITQLKNGRHQGLRTDKRLEEIMPTNHGIITSQVRMRSSTSLLNDRSFVKRYWSHYEGKGLKEKKLEVSSKAVQVFEHKGQYYYLQYNGGQWELYLHAKKPKKLHQFGFMEDIWHPHFFVGKEKHILAYRSYVPVKENPYQLKALLFNKSKSKNQTLYQSNTPFEFLGHCRNEFLIKDKKGLHIIKPTKGRTIVRSQVAPLFQDVARVRFDEKHTVLLMRHDPKAVYVRGRGCEDFFDRVKSQASASQKSVEKTPGYKKKSVPESERSGYPHLTHLLPRFWFLSYGAGNNLTNISAFTLITDPAGKNTINLQGDYFLEIEELGGTASYSYNWSSLGITLGAAYGKSWSKSSFFDFNNTNEVMAGSLSTAFNLWPFSLRPSMSYTQENINDFISKRKLKKYSYTQRLGYSRDQVDDFFQSFSLLNDIFRQETEGGENFLGSEHVVEINTRWTQWLKFSLRGTYGKLDKRDFFSGILLGGGNVSTFGDRTLHEFYGLDYTDLYGNEISTGRLQWIARAWKHYSKNSLFPFYLTETKLLLGLDYAHASRIFVNNRLLRNDAIKSYWAGMRFDTIIGYLLPLSFDFIYYIVDDNLTTDETGLLMFLRGGISF